MLKAGGKKPTNEISYQLKRKKKAKETGPALLKKKRRAKDTEQGGPSSSRKFTLDKGPNFSLLSRKSEGTRPRRV